VIHPHAARALHNGFENDGGYLLAVRGQQAGERREIALR